VNFEKPDPQEEVPELSELFEELKPERILSGVFSPQQGHVSDSPPSPTFWILSKDLSHFRH
jgi:hypothetical protein